MKRSFQSGRLVLARHRRGLKKNQLAELVDLTPQTITAYERDTRTPADETVHELARVLEVPVDFLYAAAVDAVPLNAASFRSLARMSASQRDGALAGGTLAVELNDWFESRFELPANQVPDLDPGVITPEGAAVHVRTAWGLGDLPIGNVLQEIEGRGVRIFSLAARSKEVDAFSFWREDTSTPFIIVGTHKTPERQVFDLAHELGHLVLHRDHGAPRGRDEERQADRFASAFLMPRNDLLVAAPRSPTLKDLIKAKRRWRVSVAALNYRMHQLDLTSDWHYHTLCVEISKQGRSVEPESMPREHSQVLAKLLAAVRADGMSRAELAAEALNLRQADLDALLEGLVVSVLDGDGEASGQPAARLRLVE